MCNFPITVTGSPEQAIQEFGGLCKEFAINNGNSGNFKLKVRGLPHKLDGNFTISGQTINFEISGKPIIMTCGEIDIYFKNAFEGH